MGHRKARRRGARHAGLAVVSVLAACILGEVAFRIRYAFTTPTIMLDNELGWRTNENLDLRREADTVPGRKSVVHVTTNAYGFRRFGNLRTARPKILCIGDSFTFATDVSDDETYYALLANTLDAEIFAYGAEGYSTLQEYMVLDKYLDLIDPDVVVLQYCWNDLIDNVLELERQSVRNNNGLRRPYLSDSGVLVYACPKAFGAFRDFANRRSRLLYSVLFRLDRALALSEVATPIEGRIAAEGAEHPGFKKAVAVTDRILGNIKRRCGAAPVLAFDVDAVAPYHEALVQLSERNQIEYVPVAETLHQAKEQGLTPTVAPNAHWNVLGHRFCAEALAGYMAKLQSLQTKESTAASPATAQTRH